MRICLRAECAEIRQRRHFMIIAFVCGYGFVLVAAVTIYAYIVE